MSKIAKLVLLVLFLVGAVAALGKVFVWGESITNYGAYTPWGLWVGLYIFLVGTAAGACWIAIYSTWKNAGEPGMVATISMVAAVISLACGLAFIGSDLGKPLKGITIFLNPTFSSKLAVASWTYAVFFGCAAGFFLTQAKKPFLYAAGIAATGFLLAEGLFFGGMVARVMWYSGLTTVSFITAAVAGGSALVYLVMALTAHEFGSEVNGWLKKIVIYSLLAHVGVEAAHVLLGLGGDPVKGIMLQKMLSAWPFWGIFIILGVVSPLMLLRGHQPMAALPPALILVGLAAYKYSFIRYGFSVEALPGMAVSFQHSRLSLAYTPSLVEWLIAVGFLAGALWAIQIMVEKVLIAKPMVVEKITGSKQA